MQVPQSLPFGILAHSHCESHLELRDKCFPAGTLRDDIRMTQPMYICQDRRLFCTCQVQQASVQHIPFTGDPAGPVV